MVKNLLIAGLLCVSAALGWKHLEHRRITSTAQPTRSDAYLVAQSQDASAPSNAVVFIGDSMIQRLCVSAVTDRAVNLGVGGDTTAQVLHRLKTYSSISNASLVVFCMGINDVAKGLWPETLANYRAALAVIPKGTPVLVCDLLPNGLTNAAAFNAELASLPATHIATDSLGKDGKLRPEFDSGDGVHLSPAGNRAFGDLIHANLERATRLTRPGAVKFRAL